MTNTADTMDAQQAADFETLQREAAQETQAEQQAEIITARESREQREHAKTETAALIAPFVALLCDTVAQRLPPAISEPEKNLLTEVYTDCALHYFPDGVPMSPPVVAILVTLSVFWPRYVANRDRGEPEPKPEATPAPRPAPSGTMPEAG